MSSIIRITILLTNQEALLLFYVLCLDSFEVDTPQRVTCLSAVDDKIS